MIDRVLTKGSDDEEGLLGWKGLMEGTYQRKFVGQATIGFGGCHDLLVTRMPNDQDEHGIAQRRGTPRLTRWPGKPANG